MWRAGTTSLPQRWAATLNEGSSVGPSVAVARLSLGGWPRSTGGVLGRILFGELVGDTEGDRFNFASGNGMSVSDRECPSGAWGHWE
jgi:hypothetical protein